jgi:hypothetical protein
MKDESKVILSGSFETGARNHPIFVRYDICVEESTRSISLVGIEDGIYTIEDQYAQGKHWLQARKRTERISEDFFYTASRLHKRVTNRARKIATSTGSPLEVQLSPYLQMFIEKGPAQLCLSLIDCIARVSHEKHVLDSSINRMNERLYHDRNVD